MFSASKLKNDAANKANFEEMSKEELVQKCKNILTVAQKAKQSRDELNLENGKNKIQLDAYKEMIEALTQQKLELSQRCDEFRNKLARCQTVENEKEVLERQAKRLTEENEDLFNQLEIIEKKADEQQGQLKQLLEQKGEPNDDYNTLLEENNTLKTKIKHDEEKLKNYRLKMANLAAMVKELKNYRSDLLETAKECSSDIVHWQNELKRISTIVSENVEPCKSPKPEEHDVIPENNGPNLAELQRVNSELRDEIKIYRDKLALQQNANKEQIAELQRKYAENNELNADVKKYQAELSDVKQKLGDLNVQNQCNCALIESLNDALSKYKETEIDWKYELDKCASVNMQLERELVTKNEHVHNLERNLNIVTVQLQQCGFIDAHLFDQNPLDFNMLLKRLQDHVIELKIACDDKQKLVDTLNGQLVEITNDESARVLASENLVLKDHLKRLEAEKSEVLERFNSIESIRDQVMREKEEISAKIKQLEAEKASALEQVRLLEVNQGDLASDSEKISAENQRLVQLLDELKTKDSDNTETFQKISEFEQENQRLKETIAKLEKAIENEKTNSIEQLKPIQSIKDEALKDNENLKITVNNLEVEKDTLIEQLKSIESTKNDSIQKNETLSLELTELKTQIDALKSAKSIEQEATLMISIRDKLINAYNTLINGFEVEDGEKIQLDLFNFENSADVNKFVDKFIHFCSLLGNCHKKKLQSVQENVEKLEKARDKFTQELNTKLTSLNARLNDALNEPINDNSNDTFKKIEIADKSTTTIVANVKKLESELIALKEKSQQHSPQALMELKSQKIIVADLKKQNKELSGKIADLEREKQTSLADLATLNKKNADLLKETKKLKESTARLLEELNKTKQLADDLNTRLQQKDDIIQAKQKELSAVNEKNLSNIDSELDALRKERQTLSVAVKEFKREINMLKKDKEQLELKIVALEKETAKYSKELDDEKKLHEKTKEKLDKSTKECKQKSVLSLEIEDSERSLKELKQKLDAKSKQLVTCEAELKQQADLIPAMRTQIEAANDAIASEKSNSEQLTTQIKSLKTKINELESTLSEKETAFVKLEQQLESEKVKLEDANMSLSNLMSTNQKAADTLKAERDHYKAMILSLKEKIEQLTEKLTTSEQEVAHVRREFDSYKARASSVLRQNNSIAKESENEHLQQENDELLAQIKKLQTKHEQTSNKINVLEERIATLMEEKSELHTQNDNLLKYTDTLQKEQHELQTRQQSEHNEALREQKLRNDTLNQCYRQQISDIEEKYNVEIARLKKELESVALNKTNGKYYSRNDDHQMDVKSTEREEGEGSESIESNTSIGNQPMPLDELLNMSDSDKHPSNHTYSQLSKAKQEQEAKIHHLTELLSDAEKDLAKLTQLNHILKEEIRRQQRSVEREQHAENLEYLKNVVFKFITLSNYDEKRHLVPVLNTILKLSPEEVHKLDAVARGLDQSGNSWTSYIPVPKWPGS